MNIKLPVYQILQDGKGWYIALMQGNWDVCRDHRHPSYAEAESEMRRWEKEDLEAKRAVEEVLYDWGQQCPPIRKKQIDE
jgi:hypothetical protein